MLLALVCSVSTFAVELVEIAAERVGDRAPAAVGQVLAGERDLGVRVQQGAVVDADGVGGLVFDERAMHEGAEVAQGGVV